MKNKPEQQDDEQTPQPAQSPSTPVTTDAGERSNDEQGSDRGGVTDGPGK